MSNVVFLANTVDPVTSTTYYGVGHQASITDEAQVALWNAQGKVALLGAGTRSINVAPIAATTATVSWIVDPTVTSTRVEYGTTTSYGTNANGSPLTGGGTVSANLTGLTTATLYHYRIQVVSGSYTTYTADRTFTTA